MVTDQYSHIIDENRANNARLFEEAFYGNKQEQPQQLDLSALSGIDIEQLNKVLQNPELLALLQTLAPKKNKKQGCEHQIDMFIALFLFDIIQQLLEINIGVLYNKKEQWSYV